MNTPQTALGRFGLTALESLGIPADGTAVRVRGADRLPWRSALPVFELAVDSVAVASAALDRLRAARDGHAPRPVTVDAMRVAASFASDRVLRIRGEQPDVWAPLSGFWRARDGWVRTHGNYPHHAARLRGILGLQEDADTVAVAGAIASRDALALEADAIAAGAIVAAVRTPDAWRAHPQAATVAQLPFVGVKKLADAAPRPFPGGPAPLAGVRVLDLTRVIAGPVATRDLALAGADVLRIDDPGLPEPSWQIQDTGQDKRSTLLDLRDGEDRATFDRLLTEADVVVTGYRPGSLERFGLTPGDLATAYPGLVIATLSAWGSGGPWGRRRGFDSIVQATVGIAHAEGTPEKPGALPVQALDHASGHLLAAGISAALETQRRAGGSHHVSVALARVGQELLGVPGTTLPGAASDGSLPSITIGELTCAPPPLGYEGAPTGYGRLSAGWGRDAPEWQHPPVE